MGTSAFNRTAYLTGSAFVPPVSGTRASIFLCATPLLPVKKSFSDVFNRSISMATSHIVTCYLSRLKVVLFGSAPLWIMGGENPERHFSSFRAAIRRYRMIRLGLSPMEPVAGIEPAQPAWSAGVLPTNDTGIRKKQSIKRHSASIRQYATCCLQALGYQVTHPMSITYANNQMGHLNPFL